MAVSGKWKNTAAAGGPLCRWRTKVWRTGCSRPHRRHAGLLDKNNRGVAGGYKKRMMECRGHMPGLPLPFGSAWGGAKAHALQMARLSPLLNSLGLGRALCVCLCLVCVLPRLACRTSPSCLFK